MPVEVSIRLRKPNAVVPEYHSSGAAAFDLAPLENLVIMPNEVKRAGTGLVIGAPPNHMLYITFRSSTPVRHGIIILEGIVDEDYCGDDDELGLQVWNFTQEVKRIPAGTRIAQGMFIPVTHGQFILREHMGKSRGGYGSTG